MTRKLFVVGAALIFAAVLFHGCEPGRTEDRDCPLWYNTNMCKNVGDSCNEIAVHFSTDDGVILKTTGGKCVALNGNAVCSPIRNDTGACQAVGVCTYNRNDIYSCYAECDYINGSGAGANGSYVCDFDHCQSWYDQNSCKNAGDNCSALATRFTYDGKTTGGSCANVVDPLSGVTKLTCVPVRTDNSVCKGVVQCVYGDPQSTASCTPTCTYIYGKGTGAGQPCDFLHCADWYEKNKCEKAGDDCSVVASYFLNSDGLTTAGVCTDYKSKVVCVPVRSQIGFCTAIQDCPYGKGNDLCNPNCTLIQGYATAPAGNCTLP